MSSVAQKLCEEIVDLDSKPSSSKGHTTRTIQPAKSAPNNKYNGKTRRSLSVERKKVLNKLNVQDPQTGIRLKFKESSFRKDFEDTAINTTVTGPLSCDYNINTNIRKREIKDCHCICSKRKVTKLITKHIQTTTSKVKFPNDKACAQCIETSSCGTQFLNPANLRSKSCQKEQMIKPLNSGIFSVGGRRWALSRYPVRGPDF